MFRTSAVHSISSKSEQREDIVEISLGMSLNFLLAHLLHSQMLPFPPRDNNIFRRSGMLTILVDSYCA